MFVGCIFWELHGENPFFFPIIVLRVEAGDWVLLCVA